MYPFPPRGFGAPPVGSPQMMNIPSFPTRPQPFDQFMNEEEFPRIEADDVLSQKLITRTQQITPNANEQDVINNIVSRVKNALENISAANLLPAVKIDEIREVGSYKKGTMLTKNNTADIVLMLKTLPTPETVKQLGDKVVELLKQSGIPGDVFGVVPREAGCDIAGTQAVVRLLIAVPSSELPNLDPALHLNSEAIQRNLAALRHAYWFEEHSGQPAIKMLVRLIKDIKLRCSGLAPLDVWTIELLSHYCVTCTPDLTPLPLTQAFRRFFQLLASGFLLHTSVAVADPCDQSRRINHGFDLAEADLICRTSQYIVRLIVHEKFDRLLGMTNAHEDVALRNEVDYNLNIAPLKEAYNKDQMVNSPPADRFYSRTVA